MAAALKAELGVDVELRVGRPGELSVWVGDTAVAEKQQGYFPDDDDVVEYVRQALAASLP